MKRFIASVIGIACLSFSISAAAYTMQDFYNAQADISSKQSALQEAEYEYQQADPYYIQMTAEIEFNNDITGSCRQLTGEAQQDCFSRAEERYSDTMQNAANVWAEKYGNLLAAQSDLDTANANIEPIIDDLRRQGLMS